MGSFHHYKVMTNQSPTTEFFGVESMENNMIEKQPVSLYRHSMADICILVDPNTKEIIPNQSSQVLDYMQTNHPQDSIQDLINNKILSLVCANRVSTRTNLGSTDKSEETDVYCENDNLGRFFQESLIIFRIIVELVEKWLKCSLSKRSGKHSLRPNFGAKWNFTLFTFVTFFCKFVLKI